ncbi:hypothetical protein [Caulobacter sp.]|uniref:hypothetical protein n=1 Tax=Caulobacter sp. TaxID=78 RepID=UPI002B480DEE|nr:hypothetical protein [Caulobacter sp.]HJV40087.1 hypothetical protein [Caulobacter sp.]
MKAPRKDAAALSDEPELGRAGSAADQGNANHPSLLDQCELAITDAPSIYPYKWRLEVELTSINRL